MKYPIVVPKSKGLDALLDAVERLEKKIGGEVAIRYTPEGAEIYPAPKGRRKPIAPYGRGISGRHLSDKKVA